MPWNTPGRARLPDSARRRVLGRDRLCQDCGLEPATEVDHIIPVAEGGPNTEDNAQGLCASCHGAKSTAERRRGLARYQARRPTTRKAQERHPGLS